MISEYSGRNSMGKARDKTADSKEKLCLRHLISFIGKGKEIIVYFFCLVSYLSPCFVTFIIIIIVVVVIFFICNPAVAPLPV